MTKTLTIRDEVYGRLISVKEENESFSELLERLVAGNDSQELLKSLRGKIKLGKDKKQKLFGEINRRR